MNEISPRRKALLWIAAVFVLGVALGGVLGYHVSYRVLGAGRPPTDEAKRAHMVERLTDELNLTGPQQQRLTEILTGLQAQFKAIHDQSQPLIDSARHNTRNQIREILTPEQKPKFEDFLKRYDEQKRRAGRP